MTVGIAEISKNPSIFNDSDDILEIIDKKKKIKKYIAFPAKYEDKLKDIIKDIEYQSWLKANKKALMSDENVHFKEMASSKMDKND